MTTNPILVPLPEGVEVPPGHELVWITGENQSLVGDREFAGADWCGPEKNANELVNGTLVARPIPIPEQPKAPEFEGFVLVGWADPRMDRPDDLWLVEWSGFKEILTQTPNVFEDFWLGYANARGPLYRRLK